MTTLAGFARDASDLRNRPLSDFPRISQRTAPKKGGWRTVPEVSPAQLLVENDKLLLLIHGFATDEPSAYESYRTFLCRLGRPWLSRAAGLFWPGDSWDLRGSWRDWIPLSKYIGYSRQPPRVMAGARDLMDMIGEVVTQRRQAAFPRAAAPLELSIVAHSMGCRVALELLERLAAGFVLLPRGAPHPVQVKLLALMAAAVPCYKIEPRGALERGLALPDRVGVYWSRFDTTLAGAFRPGQAGEGDRPRGLLSKDRGALGFHGWKGDAKIRPVHTALEHGEYWSSPRMARAVGTELASLEKGERRRWLAYRRQERREMRGRRVGDVV